MGVLRVEPGRRLAGTVGVPGDKSISHRALLLAALASGATEIRGLGPGRDVARTLDCLRALDVDVTPLAPDGWAVQGRGIAGLAGPPVHLDCGDSGTTMRLLAGLLSGQDRSFTLDGSEGLRRRPMDRVVAPLRGMGAQIAATEDGTPPVRGRGGRLRGAHFLLPHASAQVGSAVLLAALRARGSTSVTYPAPVRDHTERMLAAMGAPILRDGTTSRLDGPARVLHPMDGGRTRVPGDISSAAFLLAAGALVPGSEIEVPSVGLNPGRTGFLDVLAAMGADVRVVPGALVAGEPTGGVRVRHDRLWGVVVADDLVPRGIDELPLVAVLATQAEGTTVVRDASELRQKESDRIEAIADGLARMGARITATPDGWQVHGPSPLRGAAVAGHGDHRVVMALAIAALAAEGPTEVSDAGTVDDSYPAFVEAMRHLGAGVTLPT